MNEENIEHDENKVTVYAVAAAPSPSISANDDGCEADAILESGSWLS